MTKETKQKISETAALSTEEVSIRRQVKDRVFTLLFSTKEAQLELYNAINHTDYTDCEALEVVTLESAVYMSMKNDVSFVLHNQLSFYEQQSTTNPNMPLRHLFYVTEQYKRMIKKKWIYGSTLVHLSKPQFIVLYNGVKEVPERQELRLSDAYYPVEQEMEKDKEISLELVTTVININHGYNESIKSRSSLLFQYGQFVDSIHRYQKKYPIKEAAKKAIDYCIKNGILQEFLEREREAVMSSILCEYDEEETLAYIAEEQYGLGHAAGHAERDVDLIRKNSERLSVTQLAELLGKEVTYIEGIVGLIERYPEEENIELAKQMLEKIKR